MSVKWSLPLAVKAWVQIWEPEAALFNFDGPHNQIFIEVQYGTEVPDQLTLEAPVDGL